MVNQQASLLKPTFRPCKIIIHIMRTVHDRHANILHLYIRTSTHYVQQSLFANTRSCIHLISIATLTLRLFNCLAQVALISSPNQTPDWP